MDQIIASFLKNCIFPRRMKYSRTENVHETFSKSNYEIETKTKTIKYIYYEYQREEVEALPRLFKAPVPTETLLCVRTPETYLPTV